MRFGLSLKFGWFVLIWGFFPQFAIGSDNVVVKGTLVCLNQQFKETSCSDKSVTFGLRNQAGKIYPMKSSDTVETLHREKRLRTRAFQLTLKKISNSPSYELIKSQLIRDGKVYDFSYFCDVCIITTYSPGPCMCCRAETQYQEKLAESE